MSEKEKTKLVSTEKRKADESEPAKDLKKVCLKINKSTKNLYDTITIIIEEKLKSEKQAKSNEN